MPNVGSSEPDYDDDLPFRPRDRRRLGASIAVPVLVGVGVLVLAIAVLPFVLEKSEESAPPDAQAADLPQWSTDQPAWSNGTTSSANATTPDEWNRYQPERTAYTAQPVEEPSSPQRSTTAVWPDNSAPPSSDSRWATSTPAPSGFPGAQPEQLSPQLPAGTNSFEQPSRSATGASTEQNTFDRSAQATGPASQSPGSWDNHPYHKTGEAYPVGPSQATAAMQPPASAYPGPSQQSGMNDPTQAFGRAMLNGAPTTSATAPASPYPGYPAPQAGSNQSMTITNAPPPAMPAFGNEYQPSPTASYSASAATTAPSYSATTPYSTAQNAFSTPEPSSYGPSGATADLRNSASAPSYGSTPSYNATPSYPPTPAYNSTPSYAPAPSYNAPPSYDASPTYNSVPPYSNSAPSSAAPYAPSAEPSAAYPGSATPSYPSYAPSTPAAETFSPPYGGSTYGAGPSNQTGAAQFQGGIGRPATGGSYDVNRSSIY
jgi:hypothetical protein